MALLTNDLGGVSVITCAVDTEPPHGWTKKLLDNLIKSCVMTGGKPLPESDWSGAIFHEDDEPAEPADLADDSVAGRRRSTWRRPGLSSS